MLSLHLLGEFSLTGHQGEELPLRAAKARCLLAYLAFQPGGVAPRSELLGRLWSRHGKKQAQTSLRQSLLRLRDALAPNDPPVLHREADRLRLDFERIKVDALELQRCNSLAELANPDTTMLGWSGELLTDTNPRDPEFETWLANKRYDLKLHRQALLAEALQIAEELQLWVDVQRIAVRLLATEPTHEAAYRSLMRLEIANGNQAAALGYYENLKGRLAREYDEPPSRATDQLAGRIRRGKL